MSPRTTKQFEQIRKEKQKHIMEVSLRLFGGIGYHATSISKIAKEASISKGLLYNYFESKEALLLQILQQGMDELFNHYITSNENKFQPQDMKLFIHRSFSLLEKNPSYWRIYFQVLLQTGVMELFQDTLTKIYQHFMEITQDYFQRMGYKNPITETIMFGALLDGLSMQYIIAPLDFPLHQIRDQLVERYCTPLI